MILINLMDYDFTLKASLCFSLGVKAVFLKND